MNKLDKRVKFTRKIVLILYVSLLITLATNVWLYEAGNKWLWLGAKLLPLALFIPAFPKNHPNTYALLCFMVLFYFTSGVLATTMPGKLVPGLIETGVSCILFIMAMMLTRWRAQQINQQFSEQ